jgi:hypothetical protein
MHSGNVFQRLQAIIYEKKRPDHSVFPVRLQDMEAKVMLDMEGKELMKHNIQF